MSYSFFSIVNTIKDKSSEAISTISSDLKDFTAIVQEDVAEISKTVRQTMAEKSEQLRQQAEQDAAEGSDHDGKEEEGDDKEEVKKDMEKTEKTEGDEVEGQDADGGDDKPKNTDEKEQQSVLPDVIGASMASIEALRNSVPIESLRNAASIESLRNAASMETLRNSLFSFNVGSKIESLESMGSKLLNSADQFLGSLSGENAYDDSDSEGESEELSARRFRLLALQEDSETYTEPPMDVETFQKWKSATPETELAEIQAEVLEHYPTVRTKFTELVPSVVDSDTFWAHYIYKASLLAAQEQRGAELLEHALNDEEEIGWDVESPKNEEDKDDKKKLFVEDESKEDDSTEAATEPAAPSDPKPSSSTSSDGESWIELEERKDQQAPLSTSSAGSSAPAPAFKPKDESIAEGDDGLDWGDDEDADKVAVKAHEEKDKHGEDWGEWD